MAYLRNHFGMAHASIACGIQFWHSRGMPTGTRGLPGPLSVEIASLLRQHMAAQKINQPTLSRSTGIPQSTLSRLLNGQRQLYIDQLEVVCVAMELDVGEVVSRADRHVRRAHLSVVPGRAAEERPAAHEDPGIDDDVAAQQED